MPNITNIGEMERLFICSRIERGCTPITISAYRQGIRKLKIFVGWCYGAEFPGIVDAVEEECSGSPEIMRHCAIGGQLPITVLEKPNFKEDYVNWLRRTGNEQTVITYLRSFRSLAYAAMEGNYIKVFHITIKEISSPLKTCYTEAELVRLMSPPNKDNFNEYRNWVIVNFLLATGCRVSTVVDMNIGDIDFEEGMLNLNRQKNRSPVRVPMVRRLAKVLSDYIADYLEELGAKEALFPRINGTRATESIIQKAIADFNKSRKVGKTSIHLFRHTFAKSWILSGGNLLTLQRMLNHKSLKMVQHYANLYAVDIIPHAEQFSLLNRVEQIREPRKLMRKKA